MQSNLKLNGTAARGRVGRAAGRLCFGACAAGEFLLQTADGAADNSALENVGLTSPADPGLTSFHQPGAWLWPRVKSTAWGGGPPCPKLDGQRGQILQAPSADEAGSARLAAGFFEEGPRGKETRTIISSTRKAPLRYEK
jgi:hypothetical protein